MSFLTTISELSSLSPTSPSSSHAHSRCNCGGGASRSWKCDAERDRLLRYMCSDICGGDDVPLPVDVAREDDALGVEARFGAAFFLVLDFSAVRRRFTCLGIGGSDGSNVSDVEASRCRLERFLGGDDEGEEERRVCEAAGGGLTRRVTVVTVTVLPLEDVVRVRPFLRVEKKSRSVEDWTVVVIASAAKGQNSTTMAPVIGRII